MGTGMGMGAGTGVGNGASAGSGTGTGVGNGSGNGYGNGNGGRSWGGGAGNGSTTLEALPRNRVTDNIPNATTMASKSGAGYNITGALANRPIVSKKLTPYERDARVALRFRVDWSGHVLDGIIIEMSSGSPSFDNKVLQALKEWQFSRLPANRTNEIQEGVVTFVFKGV
jgi:TonB family protein